MQSPQTNTLSFKDDNISVFTPRKWTNMAPIYTVYIANCKHGEKWVLVSDLRSFHIATTKSILRKKEAIGTCVIPIPWRSWESCVYELTESYVFWQNKLKAAGDHATAKTLNPKANSPEDLANRDEKMPPSIATPILLWIYKGWTALQLPVLISGAAEHLTLRNDTRDRNYRLFRSKRTRGESHLFIRKFHFRNPWPDFDSTKTFSSNLTLVLRSKRIDTFKSASALNEVAYMR